MMTILSSIGAALGRNFVDGSWVESGTGARRDVISPIDGRSIGSVPWATREDAHTAGSRTDGPARQADRDDARVLTPIGGHPSTSARPAS